MDIKVNSWELGVLRNEILRKEILTILDSEADGFIAPEWSCFKKYDYKKLIDELFLMVDEGILVKRNCVGLAFEYPKKTTK